MAMRGCLYRMPLIVIFIIQILLFVRGGYNIGPRIRYYGGGLSLVLLIVCCLARIGRDQRRSGQSSECLSPLVAMMKLYPAHSKLHEVAMN